MKAIHFAIHSGAAYPTCRVTQDREKRTITFDLKEVTCKDCLFDSQKYYNQYWTLPLEERDRLEKEFQEKVKERLQK